MVNCGTIDNYKCMRWMVVKNNVPVQICNTIAEAEAVYCKYDCDEIRRVDADYEPPLVLEPRA